MSLNLGDDFAASLDSDQAIAFQGTDNGKIHRALAFKGEAARPTGFIVGLASFEPCGVFFEVGIHFLADSDSWSMSDCMME